MGIGQLRRTKMDMKKALVKTVSAVALALGTSVATAAVPPLQDFTVNEASVPGTAVGTLPFSADKINGSYAEVITIAADSTFDTVAYANWTSYLTNDGQTALNTQLGAGVLDFGYNMYALFTSSGDFTGTGFIGDTGSFLLYIDPEQDTTLALPADGNSPIIVGNNSDDYLIAFANDLTSAVGIVGDPGAFYFVWSDFTLTNGDQNAGTAGTQNGDLYFSAPRPFYLRVNVDGDFDQIPFAPGQTFEVVGDLSAIFAVPEPGTLALVGLVLLGFGVMRRRAT
jgi:hypothetical protein